jgi:hypothetical protein
MKLNKNYICMRDRWWALPLIIPSLLLPILSTANTYAHISTGTVILFYMPLALMISLMLFFGWAALPELSFPLSATNIRRLGYLKRSQ